MLPITVFYRIKKLLADNSFTRSSPPDLPPTPVTGCHNIHHLTINNFLRDDDAGEYYHHVCYYLLSLSEMRELTCVTSVLGNHLYTTEQHWPSVSCGTGLWPGRHSGHQPNMSSCFISILLLLMSPSVCKYPKLFSAKHKMFSIAISLPAYLYDIDTKIVYFSNHIPHDSDFKSSSLS